MRHISTEERWNLLATELASATSSEVFKLGVHLLETGIPAWEGVWKITPQDPFHAKTCEAESVSLGKSPNNFLPHFLHLLNKQESFSPFLF